MEVINLMWFQEMESRRPIGIVFGKDSVGEEVAYIGTGVGLRKLNDIDKVTTLGAPFPIEAAKVLFGIKEKK